MNGRALRLVTVDTDLCTWCLGEHGAHHPHCYVGRALAVHCDQCDRPTYKDGLCRDHWLAFLQSALEDTTSDQHAKATTSVNDAP